MFLQLPAASPRFEVWFLTAISTNLQTFGFLFTVYKLLQSLAKIYTNIFAITSRQAPALGTGQASIYGFALSLVFWPQIIWLLKRVWFLTLISTKWQTFGFLFQVFEVLYFLVKIYTNILQLPFFCSLQKLMSIHTDLFKYIWLY